VKLATNIHHALATCINYADLNNSMLRMRSHISADFFAVTSYSCKVNTMVFVLFLQVRKVNFFEQVANFDAFTCTIKICYLFKKFTLQE